MSTKLETTEYIEVGDIYGYHGYDVEITLIDGNSYYAKYLDGEMAGEEIEVDTDELYI